VKRRQIKRERIPALLIAPQRDKEPVSGKGKKRINEGRERDRLRGDEY
jgi:hypothetical protein